MNASQMPLRCLHDASSMFPPYLYDSSSGVAWIPGSNNSFVMHFLEELAQRFPKDRLLTDKELLSPYESDGLTAFAVTPRAVVIPETQEEVIEIVRTCAKHKVPFVSRGSGTSLSGAALPVEKGIVIALNRLNRIIEIDPSNRSEIPLASPFPDLGVYDLYAIIKFYFLRSFLNWQIVNYN